MSDLFDGARASHADLCAVAVKWLQRPTSAGGPNCMIAVSEVAGGWTGEIPDAIGFGLSQPCEGSTVIEVKVSRSDFLADRKKPHRKDGQGMGNWRYFMAPEGLIRVDELPPGWGLIEVNKRGHCKVLAGAAFNMRNLGWVRAGEQAAEWRLPADAGRETWLLVKLLSRLGDAEKLNRQRRDEYAERARMAARINEQNDILSAERRVASRTRRELDRYKEHFGELPGAGDETGAVQAVPRQREEVAL